MEATAITREEIVEAENRLFAAQLAADVAILDQFLHDDMIAMAPMGKTVTKEMDLDTYRTGTVLIEEATTDIENIRITGNTAISIISMKAKGKMMGNPMEGHFRYFRVWKRFDSMLKIIGASFIQIS